MNTQQIQTDNYFNDMPLPYTSGLYRSMSNEMADAMTHQYMQIQQGDDPVFEADYVASTSEAVYTNLD